MECPPLYLRRDVKQGEKGIMLEKLKDIFYDKNDIILALIIVVAAGFFITHQVDAIMSYPELMTQELQAQQEEEIPSGQETGDGETGAKPGTDVDNPDDPSGQQTPGEAETPPETQTPETQTPSSGGSEFKTAVDRTVEIPSGSHSASIASILSNAGVIPSKEAFLDAVTAANAETRLKAGTFKIPAGSTLDDVVRILTK